MKLWSLIAVAIALSAASAEAQIVNPATANLSVTLTIAEECTVAVTGGTLSFGTVGFIPAGGINATSAITVTCTSGSDYTIALGAGSGSGATTTVRKMTLVAGTDTVDYSLYQENTHTTLWGTGSDAVADTSAGSPQAFTVYGRVPSQTTPPVGTYNDTVLVTVAF